MVLLFLGIHIIVCVIIGLKLHTKQIKTRTLLFPVVVFVPVCGVLILLVDLWVNKHHKAGSREIGMEELKIQDAKFQRIEVEREEHSAMVVPLEEAIAVNDARTRRRLMLDILHRNPEEHVQLLQRARLTDDTELTHYATTTMMEIQSGYEQSIRELEREVELQEMASDEEGLIKALRKLRKELDSYINSGLITGNILNIYRRKQEGILGRLLELDPKNKNYYLDRIENWIEQEKLEDVEPALKEAVEMWPEEERVYGLLVRFYHLTHQGEMIRKVLEEMKEKEIYLSSEGKKWFSFWENEE